MPAIASYAAMVTRFGSAFIAGWDARAAASNPTFNTTTGVISGLGSDLSGNGCTLAVNNNAKFVDAGGLKRGLLLPPRLELNNYAANGDGGLKITLPASRSQRRMMAAIVYTAGNVNGQWTNPAAQKTLWTTNAAAALGQTHATGNTGNGADLSHVGKVLTKGSQYTTTRAGGEKQVAFFYCDHATCGYGYLNTIASKSAVVAVNSDTFTEIYVGYTPLPGSLNPGLGVVHAVLFFAYNTSDHGAENSATQFTESDATDVADFLLSQWSVETANNDVIAIGGDSIVTGPGVAYETIANDGGKTATLTVALSVGGSTATVDSNAGFSAGDYIIEPGTTNAERITVTGTTGGTTINLSGVSVKKAHAIGAKIISGVGNVTPYHQLWDMAQYSQAGVRLANMARPGSQLVNLAAADPANDGSMSMYVGITGRKTAVIQRATNELFNGTRSTAQALADAKTVADRARVAGADKVLVFEVLDRGDTTDTNARARAYNAGLLNFLPGSGHADAGTIDAIVRVNQHPYVGGANVDSGATAGPCFNPQTIQITGADEPTTVIGMMFDSAKVHPFAFSISAMALMFDRAMADAWGDADPYTPDAPSASAARSGNFVRVRSEALTTTCPLAPGRTGTASAGLVLKIRRNGTLIKTIAPASINTLTGAVDWGSRLDFIDYGNVGSHYGYTAEAIDAAGHTSGEIAFSSPSFDVESIDIRADALPFEDGVDGDIGWNENLVEGVLTDYWISGIVYQTGLVIDTLYLNLGTFSVPPGQTIKRVIVGFVADTTGGTDVIAWDADLVIPDGTFVQPAFRGFVTAGPGNGNGFLKIANVTTDLETLAAEAATLDLKLKITVNSGDMADEYLRVWTTTLVSIEFNSGETVDLRVRGRAVRGREFRM